MIDPYTVSFSKENSKMGPIYSVSLMPIITCVPGCKCSKECYAFRLTKYRKTVRDAWLRNTRILKGNPESFWRQTEGMIMMSRYFRFHVGGDIPDKDYLDNMFAVAKRNPHCKILCFTKRYELVNERMKQMDKPENLQLILSSWRGMEMENPYNLPEAHVLYKDGFTMAKPDAFKCNGNCFACAKAETGCWTMRNGQQVAFKEH